MEGFRFNNVQSKKKIENFQKFVINKCKLKIKKFRKKNCKIINPNFFFKY